MRTKEVLRELKCLWDWPDMPRRKWWDLWRARNGEGLRIGSWSHLRILAAIRHAK